MSTGLKAAIAIVAVLGVFVVLCAGGIFAFLKFRGTSGGLSSNVVHINMHDPNRLARSHYVSGTLNCRIRFPAGSIDIKTNQTHEPALEGDFIGEQPGRNISVSRADRGFISFNRFVSKNRDSIKSTTRMTNVTMLEEGHCTIGGLDAYAITYSSVIMGHPMRQRLIMIDAPDSKVYLLCSTSLEEQWAVNFDVLDSSMSTFELGTFAPDPPELPQFGGAQPPPNFPNPNPQPPRPVPAAAHINFDNTPDALKYLQTGRPEERRAALSYLERAAPEPAQHDGVIAVLLSLMNDTALRPSALNALKKWATKDDAAVLRGELERRVQSDPSSRALDTVDERKVLMGLLAADGDAASAKPIALSLRNFFLRDDAVAALTILGDAAEPALDDLLASSTDADTLHADLKVLESLGTRKSIVPLQRLAGGTNTDLASAADDTLQKIAARLSLKPDDYLYNLIAHYVIEPPAGYTLDAASSAPNSRQWSHAAAGRAVRSALAVSVKLVPKTYRLRYPAGANIVLAGTIEFHQIDTASTNLTTSVHYMALDGEYLIDLTASVDKADTSAGNLLTAAVKKIHAVAP